MRTAILTGFRLLAGVLPKESEAAKVGRAVLCAPQDIPKTTLNGKIDFKQRRIEDCAPYPVRVGQHALTSAATGSGQWLVLVLCSGLLLAGCVSKSKAQAQARAAFMAGQQQAIQRMQQAQAQGPTVTFIGEVRNTILPWSADLTLAKAIVAANYYGATDPVSIVLIRDGQQTTYNPASLLQGDDVLLEPRDIVELRH